LLLSIIIPVFNEESNIDLCIESICKVNFPCNVEYIIIDDGSTDNSWEHIKKAKSKISNNIITFKQQQNLGKGAAIHKGLTAASGNIVTIQDADLELDPNELVQLIQPLIESKADVVFGSRFHKGRFQVHRTYHYLANRFLTFLSNIFSNLYLSDMETCYKVMNLDIMSNLDLKAKRFGFEPEIVAKIAKLNLRVLELPINYYARSKKQGKKIGWKDGFAAIWHIIKYNIMPLSEKSTKNLPEKYLIK
jgi:glycosyltransferase involved in cell wall biosynthesis